MRAITFAQPGEPEVLVLSEVPEPALGPGEVLIDVAAAGVNRADLLQRRGFYPPPPGASDILGMECSGVIAAFGDGAMTAGLAVGEAVCALLAGGGYAERVVVPVEQVLPVPPGIGLVEAAALPEAVCTVWLNVVMTAGLRAGECLLVHGGGSGIGTMAIQVGKALGAQVAVTAGRADTLAACAELGADILINHRESDFVAELATATRGHGADVILDIIGGKYLQRNISALAIGGRLVIIGMQGGTKAELDIGALAGKRASVAAGTLRGRPVRGAGSKAEVIDQVRAKAWPLVAAGSVHPIIDTVLPLAEAAAGHRRLETGGHLGKVLLTP